MKNLCIYLSAFMLCSTAFAQNKLLNSNFEDWAVAANGLDSLAHWSSSNAVVTHPVISLRQDTGSFQGDYDAMLVTAPFGFVQYTKVGILVNGGNAVFDWNGGTGYSLTYVSGGGTPVSVKPTALNGYYKCETFAPNSQGLAQVFLTRYDTTLQKRDTLSYGSYDFVPVADYTPFTISLPDQFPSLTPDTITTIFYASNPMTVPDKNAWANLYLDSITLDAPLILPVVNFAADTTAGTTQSIISFTDSSSNMPTSWKWSFMPDNIFFEPGFSDTSKNPSLRFTVAGDYSVKLVVTNTDGSDSLTKMNYIHIDNKVGIAKVDASNPVFIYPNPAKDVLYLNSDCMGGQLQISDIYGRILMKYDKVDMRSISISDFNTGIYFVKIAKENKVWTEKILIQR